MMGLGMVAQQVDPALARAKQGKLAAVMKVYQCELPEVAPESDLIRSAFWDKVALDLRYRDVEGVETERRIWPVEFCCLQGDFLQVSA